MYTYTREQINYDAWYSSWMKQLALNYTLIELERKLHGNRKRVGKEAASHLRAIDASGSMSSQSQRKAQSRNVLAATGDEMIALSDAIEIYELFPEHTKGAQAVP